MWDDNAPKNNATTFDPSTNMPVTWMRQGWTNVSSSSGDLATLEMQGRRGIFLVVFHYREFGRNEMKWWKYCLDFGPFFLTRIAGHLNLKILHSFSNVRSRKVQHDTQIEIGLFPPRKNNQRNEIVQDFGRLFLFQDGYCYGMSYQKFPCNTYNL